MDVIEIILLVLIFTGDLAILSQLKRKNEIKRVTLMSDGKIDENALEKANVGIEELFSRARLSGYFNLGDVDTAILETNGEISFLPKPMSRCLNPKDFNFAPVRDGVPTVLVKNGEIIEENIESVQLSREELMTILLARGRLVENILLATITEAGRVDVFEKN